MRLVARRTVALKRGDEASWPKNSRCEEEEEASWPRNSRCEEG